LKIESKSDKEHLLAFEKEKNQFAAKINGLVGEIADSRKSEILALN